MDRVNLVLQFELIDEPGVKLRRAVRIQIDGEGDLRIWETPSGPPETVRVARISSISIERLESARRAA